MFKSKRIKILEERNVELRIENNELWKINHRLNKNKEINMGILNMLKAILIRCANNELEIEIKTIQEAENHNIYIEEDILRNAKRIKLIKSENILKRDEL